MSYLSNDVWLKIFGYLKFTDVISCFLLNRQINNLIESSWDKLEKLEVESIDISGKYNETEIRFGVGNFNIRISSKFGEVILCPAFRNKYIKGLFKRFFRSQDGCILKKNRRERLVEHFQYPITDRIEALRKLYNFILANIKAETWTCRMADNNEFACLNECARAAHLQKSGRPRMIIPQLTWPYAQLCNALDCAEIESGGVVNLNDGVSALNTTKTIVLKLFSIDTLDGISVIVKDWHSGLRGKRVKHFTITDKGDNANWIQYLRLNEFSLFMRTFRPIRETATSQFERTFYLKRALDENLLKVTYSLENMLNRAGRVVNYCTWFCAQELDLTAYLMLR